MIYPPFSASPLDFFVKILYHSRSVVSIGPVAQLVEQFPFKEEVLGPNPSRVT